MILNGGLAQHYERSDFSKTSTIRCTTKQWKVKWVPQVMIHIFHSFNPDQSRMSSCSSHDCYHERSALKSWPSHVCNHLLKFKLNQYPISVLMKYLIWTPVMYKYKQRFSINLYTTDCNLFSTGKEYGHGDSRYLT